MIATPAVTDDHPARRLLDDRVLARLLELLNEEGEEARVVGGAVRDALLGCRAGEIDIATTASPSEVMRRAAAAGLRAIPTGIEHGTVTLVVEGRSFEVTTLRTDVETDGRRATVRFGRDWRADAMRRDFTINALSLARDGRVHDYVDGLADLRARRIRFIGEPRARLREDFLRILRFFRFHAAYGAGDPDPEELAAIITERDGLALLSAERIQQELLKLLGTARAAEMAGTMTGCGLLTELLGGVPRTGRLHRLVEMEAALSHAPDPVLRLAALGVFVPEDALRLREKLRLSNKVVARLIASAVSPESDFTEASESDLKGLLYEVGPQLFADRLLLAAAESARPLEDLRAVLAEALALPDRWTIPVFPVSGDLLLAHGMPSGPAIGKALKELERRWIAAGFPADPDTISSLVDGLRAGTTIDSELSVSGAERPSGPGDKRRH